LLGASLQQAKLKLGDVPSQFPWTGITSEASLATTARHQVQSARVSAAASNPVPAEKEEVMFSLDSDEQTVASIEVATTCNADCRQADAGIQTEPFDKPIMLSSHTQTCTEKNTQNFISSMTAVDMSDIYGSTDVNEAFNKFNLKITTVYTRV